MDMNKLRSQAIYVKFSIGDIIIDLMTGNVGILLSKHRRISTIHDDVYLWEIIWHNGDGNPFEVPNSRYMEEDGLRLSVVAGLYDWHTTKKRIITPDEQEKI